MTARRWVTGRGALVLAAGPGSVEMIREDDGRTLLSVTASPRGHLSVHGPAADEGDGPYGETGKPGWKPPRRDGQILPRPETPGTPEGPGRPGVQGQGLHVYQDNPMFMKIHIQFAVRETADGMTLTRKPEGPGPTRVLYEWRDPVMGEANEALEQAIARMVRPDAWDTAQEMGGEATQDAYNWALDTGPFLEELRSTNPGAAGWLFRFCPHRENIRHPGQVISLLREHTRESGLETRNWRTLATLPPGALEAALGAGNPGNAAQVINALALSGEGPEPEDLRTTAAAGRGRNAQGAHGSRNRTRALALALRGMARDRETGLRDGGREQAVRDALDYADALSLEGREMRSTTWNGLRKASERWHRDMREESLRKQYQYILESRGGEPLSWESLLPETRAGGLQVVPLTCEQGLFEESLAMRHCILWYGPRCRSGLSRVFSVRREGRRTATGEIALQDGEWRVLQVRTARDHQAGEEEQEAMGEIARLYGEAETYTGRKTD